MLPKYVVLDQNRLGEVAVVRRLQEQHWRRHQRIVLSAYARYEMTKGGWKGFLNDISKIAKKPQSVFLAYPTLTTARREAECGHSVEIYDMPSTENFRGVLTRYKASELFAEREEPWFSREQASAKAQLESTDWDAYFEKTAEALRDPKVSSDAERAEVLRGLNAHRRGAFREALVSSLGTQQKLAALLEGFAPVSGRSHIVASFPSMLALNTIAGVTISYYRAVKGPNREWRKSPKVNFAVDAEGAVLAARGGEFETSDSLARLFFEDLRFLKKRIWG